MARGQWPIDLFYCVVVHYNSLCTIGAKETHCGWVQALNMLLFLAKEHETSFPEDYCNLNNNNTNI